MKIATEGASGILPSARVSTPAMKTSLRCLFLFLFALLLAQNASAHYDPRIGRFLSRDPIGEAGGFNLYGYCGNDPVNRYDYLGLDGLDGWDKFNNKIGRELDKFQKRSDRASRNLDEAIGAASRANAKLNSLPGKFGDLLNQGFDDPPPLTSFWQIPGGIFGGFRDVAGGLLFPPTDAPSPRDFYTQIISGEYNFNSMDISQNPRALGQFATNLATILAGPENFRPASPRLHLGTGLGARAPTVGTQNLVRKRDPSMGRDQCCRFIVA